MSEKEFDIFDELFTKAEKAEEAAASGGKFELPAEGDYTGKIIGCGIQTNVSVTYDDKETLKNRIKFVITAIDEKSGKQDIFLSKFYNVTYSEKGLFLPTLSKILGKKITPEFIKDKKDILKYTIGRYINFEVTHNSYADKVYVNVDNISKIVKGQELPELENIEISDAIRSKYDLFLEKE